MLIIKISDGRTYLFQWDRGVKFNLLCGSDTVTEMHFVTPNGIIRREAEGNTVNVPDAALQTAEERMTEIEGALIELASIMGGE